MATSDRRNTLALVAVALSLAVPGLSSAAAGGERVAIPASIAPGPAQLNQVWVRKYGPRHTSHVLLLIPGSPAGQANYDVLAPLLVQRVPNLAVWTLDRRENIGEDISVMQIGDPNLSLLYYSGLVPVNGQSFTPVEASLVFEGQTVGSFVSQWGAKVALDDIRQVVLAAREGGKRKVILGGHSMGAVTTPTYAAWDFDGHPGYADLEALVLIDGGQFDAFAKFLVGTPFEKPWTTVAQAEAAIAGLVSAPFGMAGAPLPDGIELWMVGVLTEIGCQYALRDPQDFSVFWLAAELLPAGLLPAGLLPDFPITNEAFMGLLFTSSESMLAAIHVDVGHLVQSGFRWSWHNGPRATVPKVCRTFTHEPGNGLEWYYPLRLDMDLLLALGTLQPTPITEALGLRPYHLKDVDLPLYVFETGLSQGGVLRAARRLIAASKIHRAELWSDPTMGHFDPLADTPNLNLFVQTVVPFLTAITTGQLRAGP